MTSPARSACRHHEPSVALPVSQAVEDIFGLEFIRIAFTDDRFRRIFVVRAPPGDRPFTTIAAVSDLS